MALLSLIAAGAIMLVSPQQRAPIYPQIVKQANPNNGYEDYIRAVDVINDPAFDTLDRWSPDSYEKSLQLKKGSPEEWSEAAERRLVQLQELDSMDLLGIRRRTLSKFGSALDHIRRGNGKRVWDPRATLSPDTLFLELQGFKSLARLYTTSAFVKFADGDSKGAVSDLLEGYTFARRIGGGSVISELVALSCQAIILASFEEHMQRISLRDAIAIRQAVDGALQEAPTVAQMFAREKEFAMAGLDELLQSPQHWMLDDDETKNSRAAEVARSMSATDLQAAKGTLKRWFDRAFAKLIARVSGDESQWLEPIDLELPTEPARIDTPQDLIDAYAAQSVPIHSQALRAVMIRRAQMRLLGLHARVSEFRWKHHRLPNSIAEAAPEALLYDPLSKGAFQYELRDGNYRLFSKGGGSIGSVELRYRQPIGSGDGEEPIPPRPRRFLETRHRELAD